MGPERAVDTDQIEDSLGETANDRAEIPLGGPGRDAQEWNLAALDRESGDETGLGAATRRCVHDLACLETTLVGLAQDLHRSRAIAERAHDIRPAERDDVGRTSLGAQFVGPSLHLDGHVGALVEVEHRRAKKPVELQIATMLVVVTPVGEAMFDQELAVEAKPGGRSGSLAAMVGLGRARREHDVGAEFARLGQEVFELADLVATHGQAGLVVAFDPDAGSSEFGRQSRQRFERCRELCERDVRDPGHVSFHRDVDAT